MRAIMLTAEQQKILQQASILVDEKLIEQFTAIRQHPNTLAELNTEDLVVMLQSANALYRSGDPLISDDEYDFLYVAELKKRHPEHPFLHEVEPEPTFAGKTVDLPVTMLSTEKAYSREEVERWASRIEKAAQALEKAFSELKFKITPKLDGYAAYDDGQILYTRGDGRKGTDISRVFERGLQVANQGQRGLGAGEIVVGRRYFDAQLADFFDNPRNFQASVIKEKELDQHAEQAIADHAAVFYPFALLPSWTGTWAQLIANFDENLKSIWHSVDYDVDGVILEILDESLKSYLGATRHHHRWQLAYKENLETAEVRILAIVPQTSRSGRITPVAELEPTRLSGALLSRATAHHYKMVLDKGIGPGALIRLARSGEVIPKIEAVIHATNPEIPEHCPSCNHPLIWDNDTLFCSNNLNCPAQITNSIEHFFRVLKNNDGFGAATIKKLYENGVRRVDEIYSLNSQQLEMMGFGPKQSQNLIAQLQRSRSEAVEDWRFLAAFGVFRMGLGNCERLLANYSLNEIFNLSETDIVAIEGFADKSASVILEGFANIKPLFEHLISLGFTLKASQHQTIDNSHPLAGKTLVFTGTLHSGTRDELSRQAKAKGAKVGNSVSVKTDYLVTGDNVGNNKIIAARDKGVNVIDEATFLDLLQGDQ